MVFSFDRRRGGALMRWWKNWALSVAGAGLPTIAGRLWICGDKSGKDRGVGAAEGCDLLILIF
jgi:hypothetical protein